MLRKHIYQKIETNFRFLPVAIEAVESAADLRFCPWEEKKKTNKVIRLTGFIWFNENKAKYEDHLNLFQYIGVA